MRLISTKPDCSGQRGAALVVGLIFLAMLSLMGVAAYLVANQEERMSGSTRDRLRAFEAAEASLRHCESLLEELIPPPASAFDGTGGLYQAPTFGDAQVYETVDWLKDSVRVIPQVAGADAIPDVSHQPRCIIERVGEIEVRRTSDERSGPQRLTIETVYRVTAMGYGASERTTANLQTIFRRQSD